MDNQLKFDEDVFKQYLLYFLLSQKSIEHLKYNPELQTLLEKMASKEDSNKTVTDEFDDLSNKNETYNVISDLIPIPEGILPDAYDAIGTALGVGAEEIKKAVVYLLNLPTEAFKKADGVFKSLQPASLFETALGGAEDLIVNSLKPVGDQLVEKLQNSKEFQDFIRLVNGLKNTLIEDLEDRLDYAGNIMCFILQPNCKKVTDSFPRQITDEIKTLIDAFADPIDTSKVGVAIKNLIDILNPFNIISKMFKLMTNILSMSPKELKELDLIGKLEGVYFGRLDDFLNHKYEEKKEGEKKEAYKLRIEKEREFRIEILGAIDHLIHSLIQLVGDHKSGEGSKNGQKSATGSAGPQLSYLQLANILDGMLKTVMGSVFTIPGLPSLNMPKNEIHRNPENEPLPIAVRSSQSISQAIAVPIRGYFGVVLRGAWEFNSHNEGLTETVASFISSLIGSFIEAIIYSLLSIVEIKESYSENEVKGELYSWPTKALWGLEDEECVYQKVVINNSLIKGLSLGNDDIEEFINKLEIMLIGLLKSASEEVIKKAQKEGSYIPNSGKDNIVTKIIRDYGALVELEHIFRDPPNTVDESDNCKFIIKTDNTQNPNHCKKTAEDKNGKRNIEIKAFSKLPMGVMRAYCNGQKTIMKPFGIKNTYSGDIKGLSEPIGKIHLIMDNKYHVKTSIDKFKLPEELE